MLDNHSFAVKLQLIFLPMIVLPMLVMTVIVIVSIPPRLIESQEQLLQLKLDQAFQHVQDSHNVMLRTGTEGDVFFRKTTESRIVSTVSAIALPMGEFFIYDPTANRFLIFPSEDRLISRSLLTTLRTESPLPQRINSSRGEGSRNIYFTRVFSPWNLIIGVAVSQRAMNSPVTRLGLIFGLVVLAILIPATIFIRRLSRTISMPITDLVETVREFGSGDFHRRADPSGKDEIAVLALSFNTMADRISRFTEELNRKVDERTRALQENLEMLQHAQFQLIEAEKLASLGSVVSGVAHEINTPLGVGVTSASFLEHQIQTMHQHFSDGTLTRSEMQSRLDQSMDSIKILMDNLQRAQVLVQSFKEVSADQLVDEMRQFNFRSYLDEILSSLHNQIKKTVKHVEIDGDPALFVHSYPGAFWQIFSNLVQNSLVHAFREGMDRDPSIRIEYKNSSGNLDIEFIDNGLGMNEDIQARAFEPFVTTRRGQGGTGLGLNIVFNIIRRLGGTVQIQSSPKGTTIIMHIANIVVPAEKTPGESAE